MDGKKWVAAALATALGAATYACGDSGDGGGTPSGPSPNEAPSATISAPADSSERSTTETVVLEGGASDPEEGKLSGSSLVWNSDRDGELGTGERVEVESLSVGPHDITLTATDSEGAEATDEVTVSLARPVGTGDSIDGVSGDEDERKFYQIDLQTSARQDVGSSQSDRADDTRPDPTPSRDTVEIRTSDGNQLGPPERQAPTANVDAGDADPSAATAAAEDQTLTVQLSGGTGNADLYLRLGDAPTPSTFDCRSSGPGNDEACRIENPGDGTWYVLVHGASSFSGVTLSVPGATSGGGTGGLEVSASTTGETPDPDGYTVTVDPGAEGERSASIGPDGSTTFPELETGDHEVELSGVAANCGVTDGSRTRTVTVPEGATASTKFSVSCSATTGTLEASVSTTGGSPDPDGYTVQLTGPESRSLSVAVDGTATFGNLAEGDYEVDLQGLADNCEVTDGDPKTVTVTAGETATVTFAVDCPTPAGDLAVSTSTTGDDQDPDGYTVTVDPGSDGPSSRSIGTDATVTFEGLAEGDHVVELSGVANNCSVDSTNPVTVTVPQGGTASVSFDLTCTNAVGDLEVSASTSGEDQDTDGYDVVVDGSSSQSIGPNGSTTFSGLDAGDHQVELTGVKSNCSVDGSNPRTVTVPEDGSTSTGFDVSCSDVPGDLEVTASTTGEDLDPDGYTVTVDPGTSSERTASIGPNGSTTFTDLSSEDHQVELSGIASNCSVDGSNPRTVTVTAGGTASTGFSVGCSATTGALEASVSTSGEDPDPDGYTVALTGPEDRSQSVDPNGTVTFGDLTEGDYEVDLQGLADNCEVTDGTPKTATVTAGSTASVSFSVDCPAPLGIVTSSPLPEATEDSAYSEQLEATGGSGTGYTWRVVSGSLPTGLTLSSDGAISGEPASDDATFTVEVEDSEGATTQKTFDLPVNMKPDVTIERPQDGLKAGEENVITFEGSADDPEGTSIVAYEWFRSEDGTPVSLGTGRVIETTLPAGSHTIWLGVEAADGLEATSETITVEIADTDPSQYDVGFRFASDVPASIRDAMRAAAPAWEAVVVGDEPAYWVNDADGLGCVPPMDEVVDDLLVFVEMADIDGDGGVVARAGPRHIRSSSDGRFPITGCITVDTADTDLADGDLQGVMEHELGHVLGIPFLWNDRGLVSGSGTDDPIFTGPEAEQAFLDVGGDTYSGDPVPLEAGDEAHWRESVFASELMTPTFVADGNTEPLSRVTGASLADVGYEVDLGGTDAYTLGQSAVRIEGEETETLDFSGDLLPGPITELDPPGGGDR